MQPDLITLALGFLISFLLEAIPGLRTWWSGLDGNPKRLVVFGLCLGIGLGGVWAACNGYDLKTGAVCPESGITPQAIIDTLINSGMAFMGAIGGYLVGSDKLRGN
jgi:hypothetical protein